MKKTYPTYIQVLLVRPAGVFLVAALTAVAMLGITTGFNLPLESQAQAPEATSQSQHLVIQRTPTPTPEPTILPSIQVKVKPNETFWELARRHCGSHTFAKSIAENNGYTSFSRLRTGAVLQITCTLE